MSSTTDSQGKEGTTEPSSTPKGVSKLPSINLKNTKLRIDWATVFGALFSVGLIVGAIIAGQSNANFFNVPALMIVLFGTMAATSISFTAEELGKAGSILTKSVVRQIHDPSNLAETLIDLSVISKKKGILALVNYEPELQKIPFLKRAIQMVVDGYDPIEIERLLSQEVDALIERHKRSASITRRASEIAPAMGLIGTLVGLVQMLADLENPETIGPAMAVALLTTFYGAILGTIIMAPLSVKLEKNSHDEATVKTLIKVAATSIARQENPRRLEMLLNSELPPFQRIQYFD